MLSFLRDGPRSGAAGCCFHQTSRLAAGPIRGDRLATQGSSANDGENVEAQTGPLYGRERPPRRIAGGASASTRDTPTEPSPEGRPASRPSVRWANS